MQSGMIKYHRCQREFDLYDPDYLKKDKPARVSDDDPRCGIASLQKFDGMVLI